MSNTLNRLYPLKVWICSQILAPLIFGILSFSKTAYFDNGFFMFLLVMFFVGLASSIPTFIVFYIAFKKLKISSDIKLRLVLLSIAIIGMLITIFCLFGKTSYSLQGNFGGVTFSIIYGISIVIAVFGFKTFRSDIAT